jgi:iron complex outermembrane receptor protein
MSTIRKTSILAVAVSMAISAQAHAQRTTTTQIEEVVVTAQKREENMQDVAISMSAMDANAIEKSFARTIDDITGMSPNLIINPILGNGTVGVSIRGMQHAEVEKSFDPAVAIYQDGIYLSSTTGALRNMWDAERIEVLRGPQGTLFGRNTIGGLVHVIRSKPTGEWGGKVVGTFAEDSQTDLKGLINLPEMGGVSVKLSAASIKGGEYFYNATRNEKEGENDLLMMTADVLFAPNDSFDFRVIYDYFDDDSPTRPLAALTAPGEGFYGLACLNLATGAPTGECLGGVNRSDDDLYTVYTTDDQYSELRTDAITIHANWQFADNHKLAFVFGDRETEEQALNEFDGTSSNVFWTDRPTLENQTSYEFRLESDWSDSLRSTFGLFLWESDYTLQQNTGVLNNINPIAATVTNYSASPLYHQEVESTAVFGQVDWDVTDRLMLSVGGRWIDEEKEACMTVTGYPVNPLQTLLGLPPGSVAYTDISGRDKTLDPYPYLLGGTVQGAAWGANCPSWAASVYDDSFDGTASWDEFTPRIAAQYSFDAGMAYVTYSEGFRSGGFNGRATAPGNTGPYDPESVESWEAGAKFTMFDNRFQLNLAAFTIEYNDKQEDIVKPGTDGQATLTVVQNASTAKMEGLEMDFIWVVTEGLSLRGNVGLLDASFDDFMASSATGMVDLSGIALRRAPDMTAGLGLLFERQMAEGHFFVATLNYTWKDDYYISASADGGDKTIPVAAGGAGYTDNPSLVEAFGLVDASINWETENWTISLFGKNLTDETYLMSFLDVGGNNVASGPNNTTPVYAPGAWSFGTPNRPRYFGAEIQLKF